VARPALATALRYAGYAVTLLSLYYVARIASQASLTLPQYTARSFAIMAAACAGYAVFPFISAYTWKLSVELVSGRRMPFDEAFGVYLKTNIAKYLPGNLMHYVGRNILGARHGWPHNQLALGSLLEVFSSIVIPFAILVAFHLLGLWTLPSALFRAAASVPDAATLAIVAAVLAIAVLALWSRLSGVVSGLRELLRQNATRGWVAELGAFALKITLLSLAGLFGATLLFYVIASGLLGIDFRGADFINVGCSLTIAGYAGILTPGVPGGLGAKESLSVILLSGYGYDKANLVMVALLARVFSVAGDVIAFLFAIRLGGRRPQ
jgi:uncharacterized membrane protein YbhN (UPF0104 family)